MAIDTQQILDEAEKLGRLVAQHPAVSRYRQALTAMEEDRDAARLMTDYQRQVEALVRQQQAGGAITDAQQRQFEDIQQKIVSHIKVKAMNLAEVEFVDLLRKVSQTMQKPLGTQPIGSAAAPPASRSPLH